MVYTLTVDTSRVADAYLMILISDIWPPLRFVSEAAAISLNYGPRPACSLLVRRAEPIH